MATERKNLSDHKVDTAADYKTYTIGIAVSEWNEEITGALLNGAVDFLKESGVPDEQILIRAVPGSFELPVAAQFMLEARDVDGVLCLGSVVRGETEHFTFVCNGVSQGIKDVSLKYSKPVIFGVLTDDTWEQAKARSGGQHGNKGVEAAAAVLKMVALKKDLEKN